MPATYWIEKLHLQAHPEGGYFAETYRSPEEVQAAHLPERYGGRRSFSTAIYFLLEHPEFSALHRIKSDEVWHFYAGSTLLVYVIDPGGKLEIIRLGNNLEAGEQFQAVVKAGCWFGSRLEKENIYALVGCTVAPGFDFADFEMADRKELLQQFPQHQSIIELLTH
ncbi:cupin domain-containing protein [Rhodocytophaga rosea]|uniref:Cupin domain-containing protein n=1 Tax=Rhodocytophaga rosea TaxID=2704465 RepID=A0A6C0GKR5_9BACT|nr:cupin domain-containing protein [Rhodocytophaga rosea]QHT68595.1 cupin domain-containing protein [Rhodocytophaga rosea]